MSATSFCKRLESATWKHKMSEWNSSSPQIMTQHMWFNPGRPRSASGPAACGLFDGAWNISNSCSWQFLSLGGAGREVTSHFLPDLKTQSRWPQFKASVAVGHSQERRWLGASPCPPPETTVNTSFCFQTKHLKKNWFVLLQPQANWSEADGAVSHEAGSGLNHDASQQLLRFTSLFFVGFFESSYWMQQYEVGLHQHNWPMMIKEKPVSRR